MDGQRFDGFTKRLASATSRRQALRGGIAALLGIAAVARNGAPTLAGGCETDAGCDGRPEGLICMPNNSCGCYTSSDCLDGSVCCEDQFSMLRCIVGDCCTTGSLNTVCPDLGHICVDNTCVPTCQDVLDSCTVDTDCCGDALCVGSTCLQPNGFGCIADIDCISGHCFSTEDPTQPCPYTDPAAAQVGCACASYCADLGASCENDACCDGLVCEEGMCVQPASTLTVHYRCCPEGATDVFAECHGNPLPGVAVELSNGTSCVTDESGNCSLLVFSGEPVSFADDTGAMPVGVYCAYSDAAGTETFINDGMTVAIEAPGLEVICDVYYTGMCNKKDDGGKPHDDGGKKPDDGGETELPDTGAGVAAAGLGGLIAGAATFAGAAAVIGKIVKPESDSEA